MSKEFSPKRMRDAENKTDAGAVALGLIGSFLLCIGAFLWSQTPEGYNNNMITACKYMFWTGLFIVVVCGIYLTVKKY